MNTFKITSLFAIASLLLSACIDNSTPANEGEDPLEQMDTEDSDELNILEAKFSRFVASPFSVFFQAINFGENQIQIIEIRNIGTITGVIHDIRIEPAEMPYTLLGGHQYLTEDDYLDPDSNDEPGLSEGNTFQIYLRYEPNMDHTPLLSENNDFNAELIISTDDPFESEISIPLSGPIIAME